MSDIDFERQHSLGQEELMRRLRVLEQKLGERYGVKLEWQGSTASVKGMGVSGTLSVEETRLAVALKLGMMMRPMAGKIRESMEVQIDRALA